MECFASIVCNNRGPARRSSSGGRTKLSLMKPIATLILVVSLGVTIGFADAPKRPRILGISHMALYVSDLEKARGFYEGFLGYAEPFNLKREDGSVRIAFVKINEDQYIELFTDPPAHEGQLNHIAIYTDSAEGMRAYLAAHGVKTPENVPKGKIGNLNFSVTDPDGHTAEIVQYEPDGWTRQAVGRFLPDTRVSSHMLHVGITIGALEPAMKFYGDNFGLAESWRGSSTGTVLSWVNMRVPEGQDYVEFMLYGAPPSAKNLGSMNHICLLTPDIEKAIAALRARSAAANYTLPYEIKIGVNGKRQANFFDPDGTRVELMEPNAFDGKVRPPSTAPPPR
jgi:catechol 2,3-dioxygenase-like lactoylglutathione lyase family enzyme